MASRPGSTTPRSTAGLSLLLFDVDGTLVRSYGGSLRAMTTAARRLFGPSFSLEEVDRNGQLDPDIVAAALALNGVQATSQQLDVFRQSCVEELRAEAAATQSLPGARELLDQLRRTPGVLLGLVTGNYPEAARLKIEAAGIDPACFVVQGFGDQAATRSELVRLAMDRAALLAGRPIPSGDVIVIGDTPRDVDSAKANGCKCLAVATGNYPVDVLRSAGANAVLADLSDPAPLWAMLGKPASVPRASSSA